MAMPSKFGEHQGSVLRPTLFTLFCNDLPDVIEDEGDIHMPADDFILSGMPISTQRFYFTK